MTMKFSDLTKKLEQARTLEATSTSAVLNHGKFYGLRSKYDGRGNLRKPLKG